MSSSLDPDQARHFIRPDLCSVYHSGNSSPQYSVVNSKGEKLIAVFTELIIGNLPVYYRQIEHIF